MLRSIRKAYDIILKDDPDTAVTMFTIRQWCNNGQVRCIKSGNKVLIDLDSLLNYINFIPDKNVEAEEEQED